MSGQAAGGKHLPSLSDGKIDADDCHGNRDELWSLKEKQS